MGREKEGGQSREGGLSEQDAKFQGMERGREVREGIRGKERRKGRWGGGGGQEEHRCCSSEEVSSGHSCREKTALSEQRL